MANAEISKYQFFRNERLTFVPSLLLFIGSVDFAGFLFFRQKPIAFLCPVDYFSLLLIPIFFNGYRLLWPFVLAYLASGFL